MAVLPLPQNPPLPPPTPTPTGVRPPMAVQEEIFATWFRCHLPKVLWIHMTVVGHYSCAMVLGEECGYLSFPLYAENALASW